MKNITLLALDTSTEACSVALWHKGEKTYLDELAQRTHTKRILPMIDELLANSGINLKQVDALAFGRGPGSFTGVRVGAGIAQGLALGADLPVIAVSNLTAMAQAAFDQAMEINTQDKVIDVQKTAIREAKEYIEDSIQAVNVKNFNGKIKIKTNEHTN